MIKKTVLDFFEVNNYRFMELSEILNIRIMSFYDLVNNTNCSLVKINNMCAMPVQYAQLYLIIDKIILHSISLSL